MEVGLALSLSAFCLELDSFVPGELNIFDLMIDRCLLCWGTLQAVWVWEYGKMWVASFDDLNFALRLLLRVMGDNMWVAGTHEAFTEFWPIIIMGSLYFAHAHEDTTHMNLHEWGHLFQIIFSTWDSLQVFLFGMEWGTGYSGCQHIGYSQILSFI